MTGSKANLGASVTARLLNRARTSGDDYQRLLTSFCFERLLFRLGASDVRDFLMPILDDVRSGRATPGTWQRGGPWT